jgi:pyruvate formate lyase activating enzyme
MDNDTLRRARFWNALDDRKVACRLCPRACVIADGARGWCNVRRNVGGTLFSAVHGRAAAAHVDPIEKKPLNHFLPGSRTFSIGTVGCNLDCAWCQNCTLSRGDPDTSRSIDLGPDQVVSLARTHDCASIAFTYNEPTVFAEYAADVADRAHAAGLRTVAVTNGYIAPDACRDLFSRIDAANVDLKAFRDDLYRRHTGGSLQPVLDSLVCMKALGVWIEVTTLIVPGLNDNPGDLAAQTAWIRDHLGRDTPFHLSAFHPDHRMRDRARTPISTLEHARDIATQAGLRFVYLGNVAGSRNDTRCPACGRVVIARDGFAVRIRLNEDGTCPCGQPIPLGNRPPT